MRAIFVTAAFIALAGCNWPSENPSMVAAFERLAKARVELKESREAASYSCGYVAGQRAIMSRMPSLFNQSDLPREPQGCQDDRANAVKHGFTTAATE